MTEKSDLIEVIAAHNAAMTAALHALVTTLQNNGALKRGEFQAALLTCMEIIKHRPGSEMTLAILHDLRQGLLD